MNVYLILCEFTALATNHLKTLTSVFPCCLVHYLFAEISGEANHTESHSHVSADVSSKETVLNAGKTNLIYLAAQALNNSASTVRDQ